MENLDQTIEDKRPEYAGFWKRFAAMVIDGVVIAFATASLKWTFIDDLRTQLEEKDDFSLYAEVSDFNEMLIKYSWMIYLVIIRWCYFAGMESSPIRATLGKWIVGLYVTDESYQRIDFARATGRHFAKIISGLILGIGFIMAGFSEKKQALHDTMSRCLVLSK